MGSSCERKNRSPVCKSPGLYLLPVIICSVVSLTFWDGLPSPPSNIESPWTSPKAFIKGTTPLPMGWFWKAEWYNWHNQTRNTDSGKQALHARDVAELSAILGLSNRLIPAEVRETCQIMGYSWIQRPSCFCLTAFYGVSASLGFSFQESQPGLTS